MDLHAEDLEAPVLYLGLILSIVVVWIASNQLGPDLAIKGVYATVGIITALVLRSHIESEQQAAPIRPRVLLKIIAVLFFLSIPVALFIDPIATLVAIGVSHGCVGLLLFDRRWISALIGSITSFSIVPLTRYLATGMWFGDGDIFKHTRFIEVVVQTGSVDGIGRYEAFPGLHYLIGVSSIISDIPAYDLLQITGIVAHLALALIVFFFIRNWTADVRLATVSAILSLLLPQLAFSSTYFYPQSLAVILLTLALAAHTIGDPTWRRSLVSLALLTAAIATHHLTFVLIWPLLGFFLLRSILLEEREISETQFRFSPNSVLLWLVPVIGYWFFSGSGFINELVFAIESIFTGSARGSASVFMIGDYSRTLENTILSEILTYGGLFMALLVLCLCLSLMAILRDTRQLQRNPFLIILGLLSGGLILKLPISIKGLPRIQHILSVFAAVGFALGIVFLVRKQSKQTRQVVSVLLAILAITSAVYASPALYLDDREANSHQLTNAEAAQLESLTNNAVTNDYSTLWITGEGLRRHGSGTIRSPSINGSSITIDGGVFIYRDSWPEHKLSVLGQGLVLSQLFLSEEPLEATISQNNHIYTSGEMGAIHNESTYHIDDGE